VAPRTPGESRIGTIAVWPTYEPCGNLTIFLTNRVE
jgi:hypothetical protein